MHFNDKTYTEAVCVSIEASSIGLQLPLNQSNANKKSEAKDVFVLLHSNGGLPGFRIINY